MKPFDLEEYLANPSKKVVTRKGLSVRILATDLEDSDFPIAAAIDNRYPISYTSRGTRNYELRHEDDNDLFFATEKHEGWININKWPDGVRDTDGIIYPTKLDIPDMPPVGVQRVATIKIEWEE